MGCGASQPASDELQLGAGAGILPAQAKQPAQTLTIGAKPTKALKPHKRQSTLTVSESASSNRDSASTEEKEKGKRKKEGSVVPVNTSLSISQPAVPAAAPNAANTALSTIPPSPRSEKTRDITPRSPRNDPSASTPTQARTLQPSEQQPRTSASSISIESIPEASTVAASASLERPRGGSNALPPLKVKGRPTTAPLASVPDELTPTEPIRKKKAKRSKEEESGTPTSGSIVEDGERTPKPRVQRSASSANLGLMSPPSKSLTRQSVMLASLAPRTKAPPTQMMSPAQRDSTMVPASAPPSAPPAAARASVFQTSASAAPASSAPTSAPSSLHFLSAEHQKQLDAYPSLWSSPTLLTAYPEAVFQHYAVISHLPPMHSELVFISKKGVAKLGRDSVDEWMRVWRNRLTAEQTNATDGAAGSSGSKAKEKKRAKGKLDTDGLLVLSRLLQMGKTGRKDVFRDDIDQWVVRRVRQELQADSDGRISKASFVNGWKQCHTGIFNTGSDVQSKPSDENPLACTIM